MLPNINVFKQYGNTEEGTRFPRAIDIADGCDVATGVVLTYCSAH